MRPRKRRSLWQVLAALLPLGLGGCGVEEHNFADVQAGAVALLQSDQQALGELLRHLGLSAEQLDVAGQVGAANSVQILDGRVRAITLSEPSLSDLSLLSRLTALESVRIDGGRIDSLQGFESTCQLRQLIVVRTELSTMDGVSNCASLRVLSLFSTAVETVPDLSALTQLQHLDLSDNRIRRIAPIVDMPALENIDLAGNRLDQCPQIRSLPQLTRLVLSRNALQDLSGLGPLHELRELLVDKNRLRDASVVDQFDQLAVLNLSDNELEQFPRMVGDLDPLMWSGNPGYEQRLASDFQTERSQLIDHGFADALPAVTDRGGWSGGGCSWSGNRPNCLMQMDRLAGVSRKYLARWHGEPLGSDPRRRGISGVVVKLSVQQGSVRVYLSQRARPKSAEVDGPAAEADFVFPYVQATVGKPKALAGSLFSDAGGVWLLFEAVDGSAQGVRAEIAPGYVP